MVRHAEGIRLLTEPLITLWADASTGVMTVISVVLAQAEAEPENLTLIQRILTNPLVLPIGLFVVFYLTFLAPERRRKADEAKRMAALKKNDRVVTVGGIHGTVASVASDSNVVTLRIDENNNTRIKVNRSAVASIVNATPENKETKEKASDSETPESK